VFNNVGSTGAFITNTAVGITYSINYDILGD